VRTASRNAILSYEKSKFAQTIRRDLADLRPRDMIDLQGFIWNTRPRE